MVGPVVAKAQIVPVQVEEKAIEIPTYLLGAEDPNPPFQLVNPHKIYPYTMLDDLTDRREVKTYQAIVLENQYLRATILPELGAGCTRSMTKWPNGRSSIAMRRSSMDW